MWDCISWKWKSLSTKWKPNWNWLEKSFNQRVILFVCNGTGPGIYEFAPVRTGHRPIVMTGPSSKIITELILARADECLNLEISYQQIMQDLSILKDKRLINSSAAFYNGYIIDGFYITDSRIRRKRPCSLIENEFVYSSSSCSRIVI